MTNGERLKEIERLLKAVRDSRVIEDYDDDGIEEYKSVRVKRPDWEDILEVLGPREGPDEEPWEEPR